eukprot:1884540-Prymnesium_polylepis.1
MLALLPIAGSLLARPRVLVVGAGPIGLEAAVSCVQAGFGVVLAERGPSVASAVRAWQHVRLFSANEINCSPAGLRALSELEVTRPDPKHCPTGAELADEYLEPLAAWLAQQGDACELLLGATVESVSRGALLKGDAIKAAGSNARDDAPFSALVDTAGGERVLDDLVAVIDCSGTYGNGNCLGRGGAPALGERALRAESQVRARRDVYLDGLPDVLGADEASFLPLAAGGCKEVRVALVGGGYSAATTLRGLLNLAAARAGAVQLEVDWLLRKPRGAGKPYAEVADDPLPSRAALVELANEVALHGVHREGITVRVHRGVGISVAKRDDGGCLVLRGTREPLDDAAPTADGRAAAVQLEDFELQPDTLVSHVGFRPSYSLA